MVAHPKTMQTVIDQRWHELRVEVDHERLAMTTCGQTPWAAHLATLRLRVVNAVRVTQPLLGRRPEIRMSGDAQRPAVP